MTGPVLRLQPHQWRGDHTIFVDVHHAALMSGDWVEIAGLELAGDGTPIGDVWLIADIHDLPAALVQP